MLRQHRILHSLRKNIGGVGRFKSFKSLSYCYNQSSVIYTSDKFLHNCFQFIINLHFQIASTTKKFNDISKFTIIKKTKYQKCRRQIPKKCCVICVICRDTPGQYCRYRKIVSQKIIFNPGKIFNLLCLVSGVQRACVSWLRQL